MMTIPFEPSTVACTCETCVSTSRLTDGDYSHEFVVSHLLSSSYIKPQETEQYINRPRRSYASSVVAVTGRAAAKKRYIRPFEIR